MLRIQPEAQQRSPALLNLCSKGGAEESNKRGNSFQVMTSEMRVINQEHGGESSRVVSKGLAEEAISNQGPE